MQRLDLVRRCFYLKVCDGLPSQEDHSPDWRREQMASWWPTGAGIRAPLPP